MQDAQQPPILLLMGVDPRVVMDIMGWCQGSMVKRYQHVIDEMKAKAGSTVQDTLWQDPKERAEVIDLASRRRSKTSQTTK